MMLAIIAIGIVLISVAIVAWNKRARDQRELEQHSITPEALQSLLAADQEILIFDVRQPLDLLAYPEIVPGAHRIPPDEVMEKPSHIPKEKEAVVYCTCPSEKTSRMVLRRVLALDFRHVRFLKGGLAGWKAKGYPVEPYTESFQLHAAT